MYKIRLINMPFAILNIPSIGLTELAAVLQSRFGEQVAVETHYLNLDFAHYMGVALYEYMAFAVESLVSGVGEWFFRQVAFPELADNTQEYFARYYPYPTRSAQVLKYAIQKKRKGLDAYLDELITRYGLDQADVVGFTSMFSQNPACFAVARKLKARNPNIITLMGGPNCEWPMGREIVQQVPQIDFAFSGPALKSLPEFVGHCLEQDWEACHRINGVLSKANVASLAGQGAPGDAAGISVYGDEPDINARVELDYGPFLEALAKHFPGGAKKPILLFRSSYGCWWGEHAQCRFCGLNGERMHYRAMSPERATEQFNALFKYPRPLYLSCIDSLMPKNLADEVLCHVDTPPGVTIFYKVKAQLGEEEAQILAKAGVKVVQVGIEAFNTPALKLMSKGATAFQNLLCLKNCLRYGIYPVWNLLVGVPGEEEAMYEKYLHDIPLLVHLPPPTGVQTVGFERYSPYFVNARQYGLDLHPSEFYSLVYPFGEDALENMAYNWTNRDYNAPYLATMCKWVDKLREKCNPWWAHWWQSEEKQAPPRLYFKQEGDPCVVYDSRTGEAIEHRLEPATGEVLRNLSRPRGLAELGENLGHLRGVDPAREVARLQERGLVFEENGRFLSLVLPGEPPPMSDQALEYFASFFGPFLASSLS